MGALALLCSRMPQLSRQLATVLDTAGAGGTLTGPAGAPELAAAELRQAAGILTGAYERLNAVWNTLSPVGGWLSTDAEALAERQADIARDIAKALGDVAEGSDDA
jgi:hypothetical protein